MAGGAAWRCAGSRIKNPDRVEGKPTHFADLGAHVNTRFRCRYGRLVGLTLWYFLNKYNSDVCFFFYLHRRQMRRYLVPRTKAVGQCCDAPDISVASLLRGGGKKTTSGLAVQNKGNASQLLYQSKAERIDSGRELLEKKNNGMVVF